MAIGRPQAIDDAPLGAGAQRRMAAERLSWLARNGRSPGEENLTAAIAARRSRLAVLWPDHAIKRPRGSRAGQLVKEKTWQTGPCKRPSSPGEGTETPAYRKAARPSRDQAQRSLCGHWGLSAADSGAGQSKRLGGPRCSRSDLTIGIRRSPNRRHDEARPQLSLAAGAAGNSDRAPAASPRPVSGGTASARRAQAVAPTATAPMSAKACCHSSAGTPICARPRAA